MCNTFNNKDQLDKEGLQPTSKGAVLGGPLGRSCGGREAGSVGTAGFCSCFGAGVSGGHFKELAEWFPMVS